MASEFKSGYCWKCGEVGDVIYSKLHDVGFICVECAEKYEVVESKCIVCEKLSDCRFIAAGTTFVCNIKGTDEENN